MKHYIGIFNYFATGEGYHLYIRSLVDKSKDQAFERFVKLAAKKWAIDESQSSLDFVKIRCKVHDFKTFNPEGNRFSPEMYKIILDAKETLSGFADGGLEFFLSYNLS